MINPMDLSAKHIIITGGSSGIGRQCAIQASRLGARVTLIARREDRLQETVQMMERPENHRYFILDLSETEKIEDLVNEIVVQSGKVDGLCHAAGIVADRILKQCKPAYIEKILRIHFGAFAELIRCLSKKDNLNNQASLVGISSCAAEKGNIAQGAYAAAKAAMNGFIRPIAQELAPREIRVNTVAFAMVNTIMFQNFLENAVNLELLKRQNLGLIDVESASNAVMFLLSDACRYITGTVLPVYAGY